MIEFINDSVYLGLVKEQLDHFGAARSGESAVKPAIAIGLGDTAEAVRSDFCDILGVREACVSVPPAPSACTSAGASAAMSGAATPSALVGPSVGGAASGGVSGSLPISAARQASVSGWPKSSSTSDSVSSAVSASTASDAVSGPPPDPNRDVPMPSMKPHPAAVTSAMQNDTRMVCRMASLGTAVQSTPLGNRRHPVSTWNCRLRTGHRRPNHRRDT